MKPPPDDPLDPLLDRWSVTPDPSPRLRADIWQKIATHDNSPRFESGPWAAFGAWLERPSFAVAFVAACAVVGVVLAEFRVGQIQRERNAQLARSYLELIDPLVTDTEPAQRS